MEHEALPTPLAHGSYIKATPIQNCIYIHQLNTSEQCEFVLATPECSEIVHYVNYMNILYCKFNFIVGTILLVSVRHFSIHFLVPIGDQNAKSFERGIGTLVGVIIWLILLTCLMATVCIRFYADSLLYITRLLKFSEYLGGTIVVCFGNGLNNIISAFGDSKNDTELFYNEILGTAIFLITVAGGLVILQKPLHLISTYFHVVLIMLCIALLLLSIAVNDQIFVLLEVVALVGLCPIFYVIMWILHYKIEKQFQKLAPGSSNAPEHQARLGITETINLKQNDPTVPNTPITAWKEFLLYSSPFTKEEFQLASQQMRIWFGVQAPFFVLLTLLIPKVDYTKNKKNWSKYNYLITIITYPTLAILSTKYWTVHVIAGLTLLHISLICSGLLAKIVLFTSKTSKPPIYFNLFVIYSHFISIHVIHTILLELISGLHTVGILLGIGRATMGITILAWANGLINIFTNLVLVSRNFKRMAFASSFGEALFIVTIGIGMSMGIRMFMNSETESKFRAGVNGPTSRIFLFIIIALYLLMTQLTGYQVRRSMGIYMILSYLIFLTFALLCEFNILHPYGTDHLNEAEPIDRDLYYIN